MLGYAERLVDRPRLVGPEHAAPVRDERLGRAVALHRGVEDGEVGGEVLRSGDGARKDREWLSSTEMTYALPPTSSLFA